MGALVFIILGVLVFLTYKQLNPTRPKLPPNAVIINEPGQPPRLQEAIQNLDTETQKK